MLRFEVRNAAGELKARNEMETQEQGQAWFDLWSATTVWGSDPLTLSSTDITAQVLEQKKIDLGLRAQEFGATVVALVYAINDSKQLSIPQLQLMMADPSLALVERLLKNGAIVTARTVIAGMTPSAFTAEDIARVLAFIDASEFVK